MSSAARIRRHARPTILLAYAGFVLVGVSAGVGGVLLLAQIGDYQVDRATIGITFFISSAGFVLGGIGTGSLIDRFGYRSALAAGGGAFILAGLYLATRPPFVAFMLVQLIVGLAGGILESTLNAYLAAMPGSTTLLNRLHAYFGVGALIGPVLATWIVGFASWSRVYLVLAVVCIPLTAGFVFAYPRSRPRKSAVQPRPVGGLLGATLRERGVLLASAMLAIYVGLEIGVGTWAYSYLVQARGLPDIVAGSAVSGYWLGLTAGRFLISPIATRLGASSVATVYVCLAGITAAAALVWLAPIAALAVAALALLGFFLGPVFPTTIAMAPQLTAPRSVPTAIGVMNAGSVLGASIAPWAAGAIAQQAGPWTLLPFAIVLAVLQVLVWRLIALTTRTLTPAPLAPVDD
jgi:fucose permease